MKSIFNLFVVFAFTFVLFSCKENTTTFNDNEGTISLSNYEAVLSKLNTFGGKKVNETFPDSTSPFIQISFASVKVNGEEVELLLREQEKEIANFSKFSGIPSVVIRNKINTDMPLASDEINYKTIQVKNNDIIDVGLNVKPFGILKEDFRVNIGLNEYTKSYISLSPSDVVTSSSNVYFKTKIDQNFRPGIINVVISVTFDKLYSNYLFLNLMVLPQVTVREKVLQDLLKDPDNLKGEQDYLKKLIVGEWKCVRQMPLPGAYLYYDDATDIYWFQSLVVKLIINDSICYGEHYSSDDKRTFFYKGNYIFVADEKHYHIILTNYFDEYFEKKGIMYPKVAYRGFILVLNSTTLVLGEYQEIESKKMETTYKFYRCFEYQKVK